MREYFERALRTSLAAAAVLLCSMSPTQAIVYSGAWDPLYGVPFVNPGSPIGFNLDWQGSVTVSVPDGCQLVANYGLFTTSPCKTGSQLTNAHVELYDAVLDVKRGDLVFNPLSMSVLSLHFASGQLTSLTTVPSNWIQPQWIGTPPSNSPYFSLLFVDSLASNLLRAIPILGLSNQIPADYFGPLLLSHPSVNFSDPDIDDWWDLVRAIGGISVSDVESNPPIYPNGTLFGLAAPAVVPEPGSLALVSLALLSIGWVVRSRRRI